MTSRALKAAVALSNTSVTLLERSCYRDAIVTLRDALYLARSAFPGDEAFLPWKESGIQFALRKASDCLGRSMSVDERQKGSAMPLTVVSDAHNGLTDLCSIHKADTMAIRIDDSRYDDDCFPSMHFEAAVILFNYGTACKCLHSSRLQRSPDILIEAYNFFQMAYGILAREFASAMDHANAMDIARTVNLALLVLDNLMQLCIQLELPVEYGKHRHKFERFSGILAQICHAPTWPSVHLAPAA
jgi:hypothetical protein